MAHTPGQDPAAGTSTARRWARLARRALLMVLLVVAAVLGGITVTRLWPVTAETQYFTANLWLSPSWEHVSTVHTPTVVGDIDLVFDGPLPAPGIEAQVQVRDEVTDLLARGRLSVDSFQPEPEELRAAVDEALGEVAWKFGFGALASTALLSALWVLGRRHGSWNRAWVASLTATGLAVALPGAAAYTTYHADNLLEFRTTSLLGRVQASGSLLTSISGQAEQAAPYVQNLLALTEALRQEYAPVEPRGTEAARFLLVSDIHGQNYYPLVREIVRSRDITAVIDTGDLVNFGLTREAEVAGLFEGIESLGVPYVFVRGNHDAVSPVDDAVLRRMAEIRNVVLLEPSAGQYVEAEIAGVRISGWNDVRYFAEQSDDFAAAQAEALEAYLAATSGRPLSDIVISHQPWGTQRTQAEGVTVAGHLHTPTLNGQHIGVGSFTGGGLFNQFIIPEDVEEETGGEIAGQPYAFDILTVGEDCGIASLTRYSYRNLVSGRPQYDDVSLINGTRVDPAPPEGRTCGGSGDEVVLTPIAPVEEPVPVEDEAVATQDP
ncbi:metallophosphoesterase family protein [Ornithinimicrobium sediminis]|uniref:metallophosphoesterase family protein n=1 Tax=Ornithinimicrobium sediminis TaxID=2904603 RepID=UPI001E531C76|nr:metallophosphoesterase family protein [Ornithinimicrobium sediminis]MCE0486068.1 metallophosphoesterase [Ornithinimicrobium sediminis]